MKSMSKPYLAIIFWALILIISIEDLILIFYIWVPNTIIQGDIEKKFIQSKKNLLLLLAIQPKKLWF